MTLPSTLKKHSEWLIVGPMGPELPKNVFSCPVIAVDGGARYYESAAIWIGDGDSHKTMVTTADHQIRLPTEKDSSDLAQALGLFEDHKTYRFHLWGFLGGRKDHELFNLGEAMSFLDTHPGCRLTFYNKNGAVSFEVLGQGSWRWSHQGMFSLGTLKKTLIKLTGEVKYPIPSTDVLLPLSSLGLSNQSRGEMILENEGPVFVYFPELE